MLTQIEGLHHVTTLASDAAATDAFHRRTLGLRRVKKTVNFDAPEVYHLYYGDGAGTPGSVTTYFPFPGARPAPRGTGEVGTVAYAVPEGALGWWAGRLEGAREETAFGERRLAFEGPDGEAFALVERAGDDRAAWTAEVPGDFAIRGFDGAHMRVADGGPTGELLRFMGYEATGTEGAVTRYAVAGGNGADRIDVEVLPDTAPAGQGAGSVHHIAFATASRARQLEVRGALVDAGHQVTPVIDRDYFWAIYFRTPGGVLFEVATGEPGFDRDEDAAHLGEALKLPAQHEHLRETVERHLTPLP